MPNRRPYRVDYAGQYRQRAAAFTDDVRAEGAIETFFDSPNAQDRGPAARAYLTKFDAEGKIVWRKVYRKLGPGSSTDVSFDIAPA